MKEHCVLHIKTIKQILESLLEQRNLVSIYVKNLRLLVTEIYKTKSGLSPPFMKALDYWLQSKAR